jgi:hypothetical protein
MFAQSEKFTILPIGYEHTSPILAQYQHHVQIQQVLDNIRHAPDFALVSHDKRSVYLVEVSTGIECKKKNYWQLQRRWQSGGTPVIYFLFQPTTFISPPATRLS